MLGLFNRRGALADGRGKLAQLFAERGGQANRAADPAIEIVTLPLLPPGHLIEEIVGGHAGVLDLVHGGLKLVKRQQALAVAFVVQPRQSEIDSDVGDLKPHVLAGHSLKRVRLVEDHHVVFGKEPKARGSQRQVGDEEGMVDDQQIGRPGPSSRLEIKAFLMSGAIAAEAISALALDRIPDAGKRPEFEVGPRAVVRPVGPELDLPELIELLLPLESSPGAGSRDFKPAQADVV